MAKALILNELINYLKLTPAKFEREIGVGSTTIVKAIDRNSELKLDNVQKILDKFPFVNKNWLLTGNGNMIDEIKNEIIPVGKHISNIKQPDDSWEGLPMYNIPITASFVESYRDDNNYEPQYYLRDPRFKDCNFGAIITGDSMHSEIRHGDFVACKEILDTRFIVFGDIYYIVTTNGLETCKYINAGKDDEHLMLQAKNDHVSPMQLPKDMLLRLYKVRGIVRGY